MDTRKNELMAKLDNKTITGEELSELRDMTRKALSDNKIIIGSMKQ